MKIVLLTIGIMLLAGAIIFLILNPFKTRNFYLEETENIDPKIAKVLKLFGGDVTALVTPQRIEKKVKDDNISLLLRKSGNPWGLTPFEFVTLRFVLLFIGIIVGLAVTVLLAPLDMVYLGLLFGIVIAILAFVYPKNVYEKKAKERESAFKMQLPEAIDYMILALTGGNYTLQIAIKVAIEYLPDNIMREELEKLYSDLESGVSIERAFDNFADRAPTEDIKIFCKALNNANKRSVSLVEILRNRADESRKNLNNEIDRRIATLESRVSIVYLFTTTVPIGLMVLAPMMFSLLEML